MENEMREPMLPRRALLETLEDRAVTVQLFQNKPYTFITVRSYYDNQEYIGFGFSKVCYPDKWDAVTGAEIAHKRALYMIIHQIRDKERSLKNQRAWSLLTSDMANTISSP